MTIEQTPDLPDWWTEREEIDRDLGPRTYEQALESLNFLAGRAPNLAAYLERAYEARKPKNLTSMPRAVEARMQAIRHELTRHNALGAILMNVRSTDHETHWARESGRNSCRVINGKPSGFAVETPGNSEFNAEDAILGLLKRINFEIFDKRQPPRDRTNPDNIVLLVENEMLGEEAALQELRRLAVETKQMPRTRTLCLVDFGRSRMAKIHPDGRVERPFEEYKF